jgi:hypothetical protein
MSPLTGNIDGLRLTRARWRQLNAAATALYGAGHPAADQVRHDADRLGRQEYTVFLPCMLCDKPTPIRVPVAIPAPGAAAAEGMLLVSGGEPEAVLCGRCNAETTADAEAAAAADPGGTP